MAQLAGFQALSVATCYPGKWQPSSFSAGVSLRRAALHLPVRCQVEEMTPTPGLTPKEMHHLRKKEERKVIRKVRKEQRARRKEEELARIPVVKPNPALLKFGKLLKHWNKPWKQKTKAYVKSKPQADSSMVERKEKVMKREAKFEASAVEGNPVMMSLFSEFEAVYKEKLMKSVDQAGGMEANSYEKESEPVFRGSQKSIGAMLGNSRADPTTQERKEIKRVSEEPISRGSDIRTGAMLGNSRVASTTQEGKDIEKLPEEPTFRGSEVKTGAMPVNSRVDTSQERKEIERQEGNRYRKLASKMASSNSRENIDALFTNPSSSSRKDVAERGAGRRVEGDLSVFGEGTISGAQEGLWTDVEDLSRQLVRRKEIPVVKSEMIGWQEGGDRSKWVRNRKYDQQVELKVTTQPVRFVGTNDAGVVDPGNLSREDDHYKSRKVSDGSLTVSNTSVPSVRSKFSTGESPVAVRASTFGAREVESSKFRDREEMHLDEKFVKESFENKFEDSVDLQRIPREESASPSKVFRDKATKIAIGKRKGKDVYLHAADLDAHETRALPRSDLDEAKQLEWLAKQLDIAGRPDGVHFSRLMRTGGLKITDGRALILVQKLGQAGNWRRALQVVEWVNSRNHFPPIKSRYLFTTLLAVLGKARRPIESLNVFEVMREHVATYPDMAAYRIIAVTLGQSGYMKELFSLMQSLRQGPDKRSKYLHGLKESGSLKPDVVIYNAALNSCVPHKHWRCALWILDELHRDKTTCPNSASFGLAIEVMVKAGKFDLAWTTLEKMELGGLNPNSTTYKVMVEALGRLGKVDLTLNMVKQMEHRGIVPDSSVYFALACALCMSGCWQDALKQINSVKVSEKPLVTTYTGLIKACKDAGLLTDAISVFKHMQGVCAPNMGTYNIMISIYGRNGMYEEAKDLFDQVKVGRIRLLHDQRRTPRLAPDVFTYDAMLGSCCRSQKWDDLEVVFRQMRLQGFRLSSEKHLWIVQAASKSRKDDLVAAIFNHLLSVKDVTSELYLLIILSCLRGGEHAGVFSHLDDMAQKGVRIGSRVQLEEFQKLALQLGEEDRPKFLSTLDSLRVTSDFDFRKARWKFRFNKQPDDLSSVPLEIGEESRQDNAAIGQNNSASFGSKVDLRVASRWANAGWGEEDGTHDVSAIPGWELLWRYSSQQTGSQHPRLKQLA